MKALAFLIICISVININSQVYKFPQNIKYPFGFMSDKISSDHQQAWYDTIKAHPDKYFIPCKGAIRPGVDPPDKSLVEAQGWTMITAAYMGDKEVFDGLFQYYQAKSNSTAGSMMGWKTTCDGYVDMGSAADGDLDIGFSLIVAHWQWPDADSSYLKKAKTVINNCKKLIKNCNGVSAIAGGYNNGAWGGCDQTDISYYTPAFFRVFAQVTGDQTWSKLADDTYTILDNCANKTTGLVPDWHTASGQPGPSGRIGYYRYDACRVPWRLSLDYLWNGNTKALEWCKKISSWAYGVGPQNIVDGYQLNGTKNGSTHNLAFVGSFTVSAMCNSQVILDNFVQEAIKIKGDYWYSTYLGNCYFLTLSGNMWRPDLIGDSTGIEDNNFNSINQSKFHVRLTSNRLFISGIEENSIISFKDLSGRIISSLIHKNGKQAYIGVNKFKSGCYIIQINSPVQQKSLNHIVSIVR